MASSPAAEGPAAQRRAPCVRRLHAHPIERHAQPIRDDLRDRRRVPLPLGGKARRAPHAAVGIDAHAGRLDARHVVHPASTEDFGAHAGVLRVTREADSHEPAACARRGLPAAQAVVVGGGERLLERLGKIAAVVTHPARRDVRVGLARDQVATADLGGIEPDACGQQIQQPLHHERAHRHAHAPIGAERRLVRGQRDGLERVRRRQIGAGQDGGGAQRLENAGDRIDMICAGVGHHARPECLHATARVGGEVHLHALLARLRGRHEVLAPCLDPLHGAAEAPCQSRSTSRGGRGAVPASPPPRPRGRRASSARSRRRRRARSRARATRPAAARWPARCA